MGEGEINMNTDKGQFYCLKSNIKMAWACKGKMGHTDPRTHSWHTCTHCAAKAGSCSVHQGTQSTRRITWSCRWRSDDPEGGVACWGLCMCVMNDKLKCLICAQLQFVETPSVCASSSLWAPLFNWQNHSTNSFHLKRKCTHSSRTLRVNIAIPISHVSPLSDSRPMFFYHICPVCIYSSLSEPMPNPVCKGQMALPLQATVYNIKKSTNW